MRFNSGMSTTRRLPNGSSWIQTLPNELLSEIFRHYVALDYSAWLLTLVCKRWQDVALATPSLWTCISASSLEIDGTVRWECSGITRYSYGRASMCYSMQHLDEAVRRAGSLPLQLHLQGTSGYQLMVKLVCEIFRSPLSSRLEELHITIDERATVTKDMAFPSFPNLRVLKLHCLSGDLADALLDSVSNSSAGSLRTMLLHSSVDQDQVDHILSTFIQLEELLNCPRDWPSNRTPNLIAPHLKQLEVVCFCPNLNRLQLPSLQTLVVNDVPFSEFDNSETRLDFPGLISIRITTKSVKWLRYTIAPRLEELSIHLHLGREATQKQLLPPNLYPTVRTLVLALWPRPYEVGDGDTKDKILISALQAVPNALSVDITSSASSRNNPKLRLQLLDRLGSTATPGEPDDILCPQLQDLRLTNRTTRSTDLAEYELYLLDRIVCARKQPPRRRLNSFLVRWCRRGSMVSIRLV